MAHSARASVPRSKPKESHAARRCSGEAGDTLARALEACFSAASLIGSQIFSTSSRDDAVLYLLLKILDSLL